MAWIRVADQLPDLDEIVFFLKDDIVIVGSRADLEDGDGWGWTSCNGEFYWVGTKWAGCADWDDEYTPTHWHALPDPREAK